MKSLLGVRIGLFVVLCLMLFLSCSEKVSVRTDSQEEFMFTINGVLVKDMNLGKDVAYFSVLRDGKPFGGAVATVGTDTLANEGNGNYYLEGFPLFGYGQTVSVSVSSFQDDFSVSKSLAIPGSFSVLELPANDKFNAGGHSVKVEWNPSVPASGYFLSLVRPDGLTGFARHDENKDRAETILPDAFRDGSELIEGVYTVYVSAYSESFPYYPGIPFNLPSGLPADNINGANGTIGAGVIAPSLTIEVTTAQ